MFFSSAGPIGPYGQELSLGPESSAPPGDRNVGPFVNLASGVSFNMETVSFDILGPFGWPGREGRLPAFPALPGVYLMTVEHRDGFLPYGVGITRRPMRARFAEHTRRYLGGKYNILDVDAANAGVRMVLWEGWGWTDAKRADYLARKADIDALADRHMAGTRVFMIDMGTTRRLLERMEASVANHFYKTDESLFDRGMLCMARRDDEVPMSAQLACTNRLYGLPPELEF